MYTYAYSTDMRDFEMLFIFDRQYDTYTMLLEIPTAPNGLDFGKMAYLKETYEFILMLNRAYKFGCWSINDDSIGYDITQFAFNIPFVLLRWLRYLNVQGDSSIRFAGLYYDTTDIDITPMQEP